MQDKTEEAIKLIRSGDRAAGRNLLVEVLKANPANDRAWLWMSAAVDTDQLRQECLEEALKINPHSEPARRGLAKFQQKRHASSREPHAKRPPTDAANRRVVVRPRGSHFVLLLLVFPLFLLQKPILDEFLELRALQDPGRCVEASAQVTDYRISVQSLSGARMEHYEIRYRFQVPGDPQWYSASDATGRTDLWISIEQRTWEQSKKSGRINARYLSENPWANQPVDRVGNPVLDVAFGWIIITLLNFIVLAQIVLVFVNYFKCKRVAHYRGVCRLRYWQAWVS